MSMDSRALRPRLCLLPAAHLVRTKHTPAHRHHLYWPQLASSRQHADSPCVTAAQNTVGSVAAPHPCRLPHGQRFCSRPGRGVNAMSGRLNVCTCHTTPPEHTNKLLDGLRSTRDSPIGSLCVQASAHVVALAPNEGTHAGQRSVLGRNRQACAMVPTQTPANWVSTDAQ